jgi:hypothetical protein
LAKQAVEKEGIPLRPARRRVLEEEPLQLVEIEEQDIDIRIGSKL